MKKNKVIMLETEEEFKEYEQLQQQDNIELANLLQMVKKVIDDGYSLKVLATEPNDLKVISVIINTLEEEQKKMTKLQKGIESMESTIRSF